MLEVFTKNLQKNFRSYARFSFCLIVAISVELFSNWRILPQRNVPILRNVVSMNFRTLCVFRHGIPDGFKISEFLPALRNVTLDASNLTYEMYERVHSMDFGQVMPSVRKLEIHRSYINNKRFMEHLSAIFPEFYQDLKLESSKDLQEFERNQQKCYPI
ncbi:unnamed protein product [Allacma fusca]|uniref:Uncharacterized protein n=1 Tax=Allacma fusca TaxID=39272 RepID=A0A8J2KJG1_9HEXA|nr:unnamed protein product [Allacma fusca]